MSWMTASSNPLPTPGYCGCMSLPRKMRLAAMNGGYVLSQEPILPEYCAISAKSGTDVPGKTLVAEVESEGPFVLTLRGENPDDVLTIRLNEDNEIETERSVSPLLAPNGAYNADDFRRTRVARLREGGVRLKVVVDEWIVEVYADDGLYTHGLLFFARDGVRRIEWTNSASVALAALH